MKATSCQLSSSALFNTPASLTAIETCARPASRHTLRLWCAACPLSRAGPCFAAWSDLLSPSTSRYRLLLQVLNHSLPLFMKTHWSCLKPSKPLNKQQAPVVSLTQDIQVPRVASSKSAQTAAQTQKHKQRGAPRFQKYGAIVANNKLKKEYPGPPRISTLRAISMAVSL